MIIKILNFFIKDLVKLKETISSKEKTSTPSPLLEVDKRSTKVASQPKVASSSKLKRGYKASKDANLKEKHKKLLKKQRTPQRYIKRRDPAATLRKVAEVEKLRQHDNLNIAEACKQVGIAASYYYKIKQKA